MKLMIWINIGIVVTSINFVLAIISFNWFAMGGWASAFCGFMAIKSTSKKE